MLPCTFPIALWLRDRKSGFSAPGPGVKERSCGQRDQPSFWLVLEYFVNLLLGVEKWLHVQNSYIVMNYTF